jgi:chloride channel protein, CIC family
MENASTAGATRWKWLPEVLQVRRFRFQSQVRLLGLSVLVGIVCGLAAAAFYVATVVVEHHVLETIVGYDPKPHPGGEVPLAWLPKLDPVFHPWLLLVVPTLGGLLCGVIIYTLAPEAEGHGTDAVIDAYHRRGGYIRPRVPIVKIFASAITIGTGGSGGREGPIAQIGAGFGSFLAGVLRLRPNERRVLLAAGMGAGIAAIFRAPLAGALFAAEVLYASPEFESEVIMPAALASVVSYSTFGSIFGWQPLFTIPPLGFNNPLELLPYMVVALWAVVLAALYTRSFYGLTRAFHSLPILPHFKPAIGAFLTGAVGLILYFAFGRSEVVLGVLSFGYGSLQWALQPDGAVTAWMLLAIALGKILTTGLTIGSGGSGGVFGPSMVIGGCAGGALGIFLRDYWPGPVPDASSCALVGMAGFFAAAAKTPFSTLVMVSEMTGGYPLLLPSLWVCVLAYMLSDKHSIYSAQVESRSRSPAHRGSYVRDVLAGVNVGQFLKGKDTPALHLSESLSTVFARLNDSGFPVLPVVDDENRLLGTVDLEEVSLASQVSELRPSILVADLMRSDTAPLCATDELDRALELFVENDLLALPIVDNLTDRHLVGLARRFDIVGAYLRHVHGQSPIDGVRAD